MLELYKKCVQVFGWSLLTLDSTDFDTLIDFIWLADKPDPDVRVIGGKTYTRAKTAPKWL